MMNLCVKKSFKIILVDLYTKTEPDLYDVCHKAGRGK